MKALSPNRMIAWDGALRISLVRYSFLIKCVKAYLNTAVNLLHSLASPFRGERIPISWYLSIHTYFIRSGFVSIALSSGGELLWTKKISLYDAEDLLLRLRCHSIEVGDIVSKKTKDFECIIECQDDNVRASFFVDNQCDSMILKKADIERAMTKLRRARIQEGVKDS